MTRTGWIGENQEDGSRPAMPQTEMLLSRREQQAGVLETMLARAAADDARALREEAASRADPDEYAANLVSRGYSPGLLSQLSQRLADTEAEAAAEEDKLAKTARRAERMQRDHAGGRISVVDIARMQGADIDEGDVGKVERLQRRAASLRRQIAEAQAMVAPRPQPEEDPAEAATRRAHQAFREVIRARLAEAQAARAQPREPRPFAGPGAGAAREEDCEVCAAAREVEAQRAAPRDYGEITRVADADGMGQLGTLTGRLAR